MPKDTDNNDSPDLLNALESIKGLLEQSENKLSAARESLKKYSNGMKQRLLVARGLLHQPKVLFLDEPFAFFDEHRMLETLHALPTLSDELAQIWIIAQQLPEAAQVDAHIRCSQDSVELHVAAPVQRRPELRATTDSHDAV